MIRKSAERALLVLISTAFATLLLAAVFQIHPLCGVAHGTDATFIRPGC